DQGRIVAQLEAFMADWRGDVPFAELKSRWDYKQVDRIRGQAIMQVKVLRNYRVALMPVAEADPEMWFLHLYRRQTTNQEEIERAKERAKNILEHYVE
ncbi:MAG TPA: hypothetical protein VKX96_17580, partial [Chloroflexota bacterium]|nr:hypothetical protein [Chloroflexota bacterium]